MYYIVYYLILFLVRRLWSPSISYDKWGWVRVYSFHAYSIVKCPLTLASLQGLDGARWVSTNQAGLACTGE